MMLTAGEFEQVLGTPLSDILEWEEDGEALGNHESSAAAELLNLDKIYTKAATDWLVARKDSRTYFEPKNNGLISLAGYVPTHCQDD